jgi:hypothetical protein
MNRRNLSSAERLALAEFEAECPSPLAGRRPSPGFLRAMVASRLKAIPESLAQNETSKPVKQS